MILYIRYASFIVVFTKMPFINSKIPNKPIKTLLRLISSKSPYYKYPLSSQIHLIYKNNTINIFQMILTFSQP